MLLAVLGLGGCSTVQVHVIDDSTGAGLSGATVSWRNVDGKTGAIKSDFAGDAVLFALVPLRTLRVTKDGYMPFEADIKELGEGDEIKLDARLVPEGNEPSGFAK
jgi:hypothetical protein